MPLEDRIVVRVSIWDHALEDGEVAWREFDREELKKSSALRAELVAFARDEAKAILKKMGLE